MIPFVLAAEGAPPEDLAKWFGSIMLTMLVSSVASIIGTRLVAKRNGHAPPDVETPSQLDRIEGKVDLVDKEVKEIRSDMRVADERAATAAANHGALKERVDEGFKAHTRYREDQAEQLTKLREDFIRFETRQEARATAPESPRARRRAAGG